MKLGVEVLISLITIAAGLLTLAFRERVNPVVGVRFGYTYFSKGVWKKVNTIIGIAFLIVGALFLVVAIAIRPPVLPFIIAIALLILVISYLSYVISKRRYELEDMRTPAEGGIPIEFNLARDLAISTLLLVLYLVVIFLLWNRLPERYAIHIGISGPDMYAGKLVGAILIPLLTMVTVIVLIPLLRFNPMLLWLPTTGILVIIQAFLVYSFSILAAYNAGIISTVMLEAAVWIGIAVLIAIILLKYRTLRIKHVA